MLINKALAAFRATNPTYTVERSLVNTDKWVLKDAEGVRLTSGLGHTRQEVEAIKNDAILRAKIASAMQEMISVKTLTMAMMLAGAPDAGARGLAVKMLPRLIDIIGSDNEEGGPVVENDNGVTH